MTVAGTSPASIQSFFASCPEMLFVARSDGRLLQWSDPLDELFGPALAQSGSLAELAHPEDRDAVAGEWRRLCQGDGPVQFTYRLLDDRGVYRAMTCSLRRAPSGNLIHGSLRTPSSTARKGLADHELLLNTLIGHIDVCLWAYDRHGTYTYQDGKGLQSVGLRRGEYVGHNVFDIFPPESESVRQMRQALAGQSVHAFSEFGGLEWESWLVPVHRDGDVSEVIAFSLDISATRRAERELRTQIEMIQNQRRVIRNLSTPIIEVWDGVLTLPMVGVLDSVRTADVMDSLLTRIVNAQARFAILDLTGVEVVDTKVASHLVELVAAIRLLGAEGIITGIKPTVAQTMVALGLDLSNMVTQRNLRAGLSYCIRHLASPKHATAPRSS